MFGLKNNLIKVLYRKITNRKFYQFAHGCYAGDGIGLLSKAIKLKIQKIAYNSEIFVMDVNNKSDYDIKELKYYSYDLKKNDIAVLHYTMDSPINDFVANLNCKKWFYYHNITPAEFFKDRNHFFYESCLKAREKLKFYSDKFDKCITPSEYNAYELKKVGFQNIMVCSLPKDFSELQIKPDEIELSKFDDDKTNILFVGRIVPHKNYNELLNFFDYYKLQNPNSRLLLPGHKEDWYMKELNKIIDEKKINDVIFFGRIEQSKLNALYKSADVFLCLSEHEGYCMPIIEAMYFGIPVIALNRGAVKETMDGSGILIEEIDYQKISSLIQKLQTDKEYKTKIVQLQYENLKKKYGLIF